MAYFNSYDNCDCPNLTGEICCPDEQHNRVSVGFGDACCGRMPYATSGSQVCCAGQLHDAYGQQCCGGEMVSQDFKCCGGGEKGMVYSHLPGKTPCMSHRMWRAERKGGGVIGPVNQTNN